MQDHVGRSSGHCTFEHSFLGARFRSFEGSPKTSEELPNLQLHEEREQVPLCDVLLRVHASRCPPYCKRSVSRRREHFNYQHAVGCCALVFSQSDHLSSTCRGSGAEMGAACIGRAVGNGNRDETWVSDDKPVTCSNLVMDDNGMPTADVIFATEQEWAAETTQALGIDPDVFEGFDGKLYLVWGSHMPGGAQIVLLDDDGFVSPDTVGKTSVTSASGAVAEAYQIVPLATRTPTMWNSQTLALVRHQLFFRKNVVGLSTTTCSGLGASAAMAWAQHTRRSWGDQQTPSDLTWTRTEWTWQCLTALRRTLAALTSCGLP